MKVICKYPDNNTNIPEEEIKYYYQQALKAGKCDVDELESFVVYETENGSEDVSIEVITKKKRFERIRRITGYLSGDITSWNDAKRAEEADRVKHV